MINEAVIREIHDLKTLKDAVFLVHNYQWGEVQDQADYLGDSLDLSRRAASVPNKTIVFCGVRFMAETAKILSPEKTVLLPRQDAGCPMAQMADTESLRQLKSMHPDAKVVTYVNSTAEVKAESDVCCTSANAVKVVQSIDSDKIIFTPDKNLASWVQRFTDKTIIPWDGFCYVHHQFTVKEVRAAKEAHPDAVLMVHPECRPEVVDIADEVLSTSGMVRLAKESSAKLFLVGTEEGMLYRLKKENPDKTFLSAGPAKACVGMKLTHLEDVLQSLRNNQYEMKLPEDIMNKARAALNRMLDYV